MHAHKRRPLVQNAHGQRGMDLIADQIPVKDQSERPGFGRQDGFGNFLDQSLRTPAVFDKVAYRANLKAIAAGEFKQLELAMVPSHS
jgi:hypothetical protein